MPRVSGGVRLRGNTPPKTPIICDSRYLHAVPRRGLRREDAAAYVGVSPTKFDQLVQDGRMPKPKRIDGCVIWDIRALDLAFDALDESEGASDWDDVPPWQ